MSDENLGTGAAGCTLHPALTAAEYEDHDCGSTATVKATLANVGNDPVAAQEALDAELDKDAPRQTLVAKLEKVVDGGTDE